MAERTVLVVGAGAAGLFAAIAAAEAGADVVLMEKTNRIGTKILISGNGKCNIAHDGPLEDVIRAFQKHEALFIRPSCYRMSNAQIMSLFTDAGLELSTRSDGRVFPTTGSAKDVVAILTHRLLNLGVRIYLNTSVAGLHTEAGAITGVSVVATRQPTAKPMKTPEFGARALLGRVLQGDSAPADSWTGPGLIPCKRVVVATGGSSYPASGTTGEGWKWLRALGHEIVRPRAALAPIYLVNPLTHLSGIGLASIRLCLRSAGKKIAEESGDLLFTHQGVSGPAALRLSRRAALELELSEPTLDVDFLSDRTSDSWTRELETVRDTTVIRFLQSKMPERIAHEVAATCGCQPSMALATMGRKGRSRLIEGLKSWILGTVRAVPIERGEVTAGGVALAEVDPQSMRSRLVCGLYIAGELLDVAGPVGGYNLQAAFSSGFQAGKSAAGDALADSD